MKVRGRSLPLPICKRALGLLGGGQEGDGKRKKDAWKCLHQFPLLAGTAPARPTHTNASIADDLE